MIVNHSEGISVYDEKTKQWKTFRDFGKGHFPETEHFTKSVRINKKNEACFLNTSGAGVISGGKLQLLKNDYFNKTPHGSFMLECVENELWIFSAIKNQIYKIKNGKTIEVNHLNLKTALENRKITHANYLPDGKLWIATYSGMLRYDPKTDVVQVFYPEYSFSDCLIDRENNYWLTTLQNGILRLPNLHFLVWNSNDKKLSNDRLTKITADESHIYFATLNGTINSLKRQTGDVRQLYAGNGADIQCFEYINDDRSLYFSTNNSLFALKNDKLIIQHESLAPPKSILKVNNQYLMASSFGTYVYSKGKEHESYRITNSWSRKVMYDSALNSCWIAANDGLIKSEMVNSKWKSTDTLIRNKQILSVDFDTDRQLLYALAFDGGIYEVNTHKSQQLIGKLPEKVQAYTLKFYRNKIYLATNNGVWILDKSTQKWETINKFTGAVSDNIQGFSIVANTLWIATGKGLQKIPLPYKKDYVQPLVYLKNIKIDERTVSSITNLTLDYHQTLILVPETSNYTGNGNYQYAYRLKGHYNDWNLLPADVEQIIIPNIPSGKFEIELKVVDYSGRSSENIILSGYVYPPFWLTWWFIGIIVVLFLVVVVFIFRLQLKKRQRKLEQQNELNASKLTAIKLQMNPHFIFNVLNSIKSYIYENDRRKATEYLEDFSDLIRRTLDMSDLQYVSLEEEIQLIKLYIELEAMMLSPDFSYSVEIDEQIDVYGMRVPALLLQPHIENAFKHGLRHKAGEKRLVISLFYVNSTTIRIEVTDNGIGRVAAEEINKMNTHKHKSFATNAIEKRISLINSHGIQKIHLETIDLFDDSANPTGTKIVIEIE